MRSILLRYSALVTVLIILSLCSKKTEMVSHKINSYDFLNEVLRDTVNLKLINQKLIISYIVTVNPPNFHGTLAEKLGESDTTFLSSQFNSQFLTDTLRNYGFEILKMNDISEIAKKLPPDSIWGYIHQNIGPGYYSVRKPIFNKTYDKVYFVIGYICGPYCGHSRSYILEKVNNSWVIKETLGFSES